MKAVVKYDRKYYKYTTSDTETTFIPNGTITATSGWSNYKNAFDNNSGTYASCGTSTDYIDIVFPTEMKITGFSATGNWVSGKAQAGRFKVCNVINGVETDIATTTGDNNTATYTTSATFDEISTNHLRLYLTTNYKSEAPTTTYPARIVDITLTGYDWLITEGTSAGYNYYIDISTYYLPKTDDKYYAIAQ